MKYSIFGLSLAVFISIISATPVMANNIEVGNTPIVSIRVASLSTTGLFEVFGTVVDDNLENYHFRVIKDGNSLGHTCLLPDALFALENQGYASTTLAREACGFNYNKSVYTSLSFTDQLVASLNTEDLVAFGGYGDYWLYLGARDAEGNREAIDYLLDPKVKITLNSIPVTSSTQSASPSPISSSGSGSSSSISGGHRRVISGEILGASTIPACSDYLTTYIKFGANNDPEEVKKLQIFLNQFFEVNNPVTGFYGPITLDMVNKFQKHQAVAILLPWEIAGLSTNGPTGYVYKTTKRWINILKCPELILSSPIPQLP